MLLRFLSLVSVLSLATLLSGCGSTPVRQDASLLPRSILVLPPTNRSVEVSAPYTFLSTISRPLADRGYYVFPVAVIDRLMRENGMHTPAQMHQIPLDKLYEHTGADAVLYVDINDWGQKYQVVRSNTVVSASLKLVRTSNGEVLWTGNAKAVDSGSNNSNQGLAGVLISAVVDQVVGSIVDNTYRLSKQANYAALQHLYDGPLLIEYQQALGAKP